LKNLLKISALALVLLALPMSAFADSVASMSLVSANSGTTPNGAEDVGPYGITANGTSLNAFCLDLSRNMSLGETWSADVEVLSTQSSEDQKAAAIILSEINAGKISNVNGQLEIWALNDLNDAVADGFNSADQTNLTTVEFEAAIPSPLYGNAFYNQFTDYVSTNGQAQDFISQSVPVAPTPEPGSLFLFGTGLMGAAGMAYRKVLASRS
jgi:hypothetical protein